MPILYNYFRLCVPDKTITFKAGIMKIKAGHSISNRVNRELLLAYALMEAFLSLQKIKSGRMVQIDRSAILSSLMQLAIHSLRSCLQMIKSLMHSIRGILTLRVLRSHACDWMNLIPNLSTHGMGKARNFSLLGLFHNLPLLAARHFMMEMWMRPWKILVI